MRAKLAWVGIDLLSRGINPSTISAGRLNDSVRNGKRWIPAAIDTNFSLPQYLIRCSDADTGDFFIDKYQDEVKAYSKQ